MDRKEKAVALHTQGCNCCQAVVCAFADRIPVDEQTLKRLSEGFGAGMGGLREVCGAVSGMTIVASYLETAPENDPKKSKTYARVQELANAFKTKNGSILCRELLGEPGKPKLRSCPGCIEDAAALIEQTYGV